MRARNNQNLPKGWEIKKLGEVCDFYNGKAHEKIIDKNGKYIVINSKFISSNGKVIKRTNSQLFPLCKNDIVFVMSDVPNGKALAKCFLVDKDDTYSLNQRIGLIRSKNFDFNYLFYHLNRHKYLLSFNNGENQTNLRKKDILNCPLLIPPLPEQKRIVSILDRAFEAIDKAKANAEQNLKNAKELFESYLNSIFENGKLKVDSREWVARKLGEVCDIKNGGTPKTNNSEYWDGNINWITPKDLGKISNKYVYETPRKITELGLKKSSAKLLPINSIILSTRAPIGHLAINKTEMATNQGCKGIIPSPIIITEFIYYFLSNSIEELNKLGTGATFKELSSRALSNIKVPFPKALKTQKQIVQKLDTLQAETKKLEVIYQKKIDNLEELKKSVLQKAFRGELNKREISL